MKHFFAHASFLVLLVMATSVMAQPVASPHGEMTVDCRTCHADESWETGDGPIAFDHDATGFPLRGVHVGVACEFCHVSLEFSNIGVMCADCHTDAHQGSLGFDCEECHDEKGWENRSLMRDRHDTTAFPLRGAHSQTDCNACHTGPIETTYAMTPTDCYACHATEYQATTSPEHASLGYDHDCTMCHDPFGSGWTGQRFLHPTSFLLTGAHAVTNCTSCHIDGLTSLPTDCITCHQSEYDTSTDPEHLSAGFPIDCASCHGTFAWTPADFDHNATAFALTGAHMSALCASCHSDVYTGTPTDCDACHQTEYDATTDPGHAASGFPVTCDDCHSTGDWVPANWDHDSLFPIYSGKHDEEWSNCVDCHLTPTDYSHFECIFCHEHNNRTDVDNDHDEERDYEYLSTACLECHPQGDE